MEYLYLIQQKKLYVKECNYNLYIAKIPVDDNHPEIAKEDKTEQGTEKTLYLYSSFIKKKFVKKGLLHGALGTVTEIFYWPDKVPPNDRLLVIICVHLDNYIGSVINDAVPIATGTSSWKSGNVSCSGTHFALFLT